MAACIESVATATPRWMRLHSGARRLADDALADCLERASRDASEIDLLINAGIYREDNLAEPALAAMIQEDVGANPEPRSAHATFSFDVANGGAGVLSALEIADGLIASQTVALAAVVASDSNPGLGASFPFPNAGGALLLRRGPSGAGFCGFASQTFPEFADRFESQIEWRSRAHASPFEAAGRNVPVLVEREDFGALAASCGATVARALLDRFGLCAGDLQLLVASTYPRSVADAIALQLSLPPERVARPREALVGAHSAGVIAALEPAWSSGQLAAASSVLFVAVGAGITAVAALYRPVPPV